jgi:3-phosphoshikimate 1-carboxyvinyltransferase
VSPGALPVAGDFSAAFFWLVAGTIAPQGEVVLRGVGLNPGRIGGLAVLRRMGARIDVSNERTEAGEPVGDLTVRPAPLAACDIAPEEIPALVDELPALAVAQAYARGISRVRGAGELRVKESDRIRAVVNALEALGGTALEVEDGWDLTGGPLAGGVVESRGDHRIAMAFGIAALGAQGPARVREGEMIDTSYPRFYSDLRDRVTSR